METIKEIRQRLGLSQADFAKSVSVAPSTVYLWDARKSEPTSNQLRSIAKFAGVSMDMIDFDAINRRDRSQKPTT